MREIRASLPKKQGANSPNLRTTLNKQTSHHRPVKPQHGPWTKHHEPPLSLHIHNGNDSEDKKPPCNPANEEGLPPLATRLKLPLMRPPCVPALRRSFAQNPLSRQVSSLFLSTNVQNTPSPSPSPSLQENAIPTDFVDYHERASELWIYSRIAPRR